MTSPDPHRNHVWPRGATMGQVCFAALSSTAPASMVFIAFTSVFQNAFAVRAVQ